MSRTHKRNECGVGVELRYVCMTLGGAPPTTEICSDDLRLKLLFCLD